MIAGTLDVFLELMGALFMLGLLALFGYAVVVALRTPRRPDR
jgi:hypothetical protein